MQRYILRRILQMVPVLFAVSFLVFISVRLLPGDPARMIAGLEASEEVVQQIRHELGLDQPLLIQYVRFLGGILTGDLGTSLYFNTPVYEELAIRLPATLQLALVGTALAVVIGVLGGVLSAMYRGKWIDQLAIVLSLAGVSMPTFWLGILFIQFFSVQLGWLPSSGYGTWKHLVMPALTLGLYGAGRIARLTRSSMLEVLTADYVRTAHAKGLHPRAVVFKHAFLSAVIPVVTVTGLEFGSFLGKAVISESVFAWPGIARLIVDAVLHRDFPIIQGGVLWLALMFAGINVLVDVLYGYLDPRIRYT
ncbi:MAG: ABC transporter permease [Firmicutes bacterium]|nr:ABC transporter permease [Bacillota bacterium]